MTLTINRKTVFLRSIFTNRQIITEMLELVSTNFHAVKNEMFLRHAIL